MRKRGAGQRDGMGLLGRFTVRPHPARLSCYTGIVKQLGVDIVAVARIRALGERYGQRFLNRVYSASELATCDRPDRWQCLAGRWAAKEAVIKLLPPADLPALREIEIAPGPEGAPIAVIRGTPWFNCSLSISHEREYAVAVAMVTGGEYGSMYESGDS
jgi:holo-[acyl-carrier protein] synthase